MNIMNISFCVLYFMLILVDFLNDFRSKRPLFFTVFLSVNTIKNANNLKGILNMN